MVVLNEGTNRIKDLVTDDINKGQLGSGGTAPTSSDTDLETADATTLLTLDLKTKTDKATKFDYILPSTGGTTTTYKEFKLNSSSSSTDYDRIVFTGISFTNNGNEDLNITKIYNFLGT